MEMYLCYEDNKVYTLSETNFVVYNVTKHQKIMDLNIKGGTAFDRIPLSDVICLGLERSIVIRKNAQFMTKFELKGMPECIIYMNNYFIVGGDFDHIMLINIPMGMRIFNIPIEVSGISLIKGDGINHITFSTYCGLIGHGDIRLSQHPIFVLLIQAFLPD